MSSPFSRRQSCRATSLLAAAGRHLLLLGGLAALRGAALAAPAALSATQLRQLSLEELLNVEVTSVTRYPEKVRDAPAAIEVVTGDEIRRSAAMTLPEALRLAPNLDVAQKNPHDWGISARGFNTALANKLLVMIDGRSVYTPLFSGVFWDVQDYLLEDIDRIEVVSGPGGTLWGANAVNGVINVITKSARDTQGLYTEAGGGTALRDFAAIRYGVRVSPNVAVRVYGKFFDGNHDVTATGAAEPDAWTMRRGGFRLDATVSPGATATVSGDIYHGSEYIVTGGIQRVNGGNLLGRWSQTFAGGGSINAQLYYDHTHLADPITNQFGSRQYLVDDLDTYDFDFQHHLVPLGRQHLLWGVGYRLTRDEVQNASNTAFLPPQRDLELFSGFLQDDITLSDSVALTAGTKLEHNGYTGRETEPSIRLRWTPVSNQLFWAAISRAVRMPSRYDRDIFLPRPPPVVASGSQNFVSETVIAYEAGYRAKLGSDFSTALSLFYNDYAHLRSFAPATGTNLPVIFANNLAARTHGAEVSATYQATSNWRLRAGYDLLREHLEFTPPGDIYGGRNELSDPANQVFLASSLNLPRNVACDVTARWVDQLLTTTGTVPAYAEADVRLTWQPTREMEFSLAGQNLLHPHHPEFGIAIARREEIPRSVYAKVALRF